MRRTFVGGNWKCNGTLDFMSKFPSTVLKNLSFDTSRFEVVVAPSTIHIGRVQAELGDSKV